MFELKEGKPLTQINADIIKAYYRQLKEIAIELEASPDEPLLQSVLRMPESLNIDKHNVDPEETEKLINTLKMAIEALDKFRSIEGEALSKDISQRITLIESFLVKLEPFEKERTELIRAKLENSLNEFVPKESIDKNRYEQELIYYLEKLDISEEKTRLKHHCHYFLDVMKENDQVGRKLGFVAQEIGREINTIGSKANHSEIQKLVVLMKDELEKIKEQLLNIL
jgi:uncharacterized protein (TIGR00255 family)